MPGSPSASSSSSSAASSSAYAVFRPRRGVWVARISALLVLVVFGVMAVAMPQGGVVGGKTSDRVTLVVFAILVAAFLWRYTRLRAVPTAEGLTVVNLIHTQQVEWAEVLRVGFSGGAPWVVLELTDTEELAVMAIQRADGAHGRAEAARLAALVEHHGLAQPP